MTTNNTTLLTGNTYPVKEQLKALGATWNPRARGWNAPTENVDAARALVYPKTPATKYRSRLYVTNSGHEIMINNNGRCEDAPCCGCCS